jgi:hypothetical protein
MKYFFLSICLSLLFSQVNSQIIKSIGINGGVSIANQDFYESNLDYRLGLYTSLSLEFLKSKHFNIVTEIAYAAKGSQQEIILTTIDQPEGIGKKTYDTKFSYLEFSPLMKAHYEKDHVALFVLLGPRMDVQIYQKSDFNFKEPADEYNKFIFGLTAGAGLEVKLKQFGIKVESQYHHDFTDVLYSDKSGLFIRNRAFIISLGLKYYLKHSKDS